MAENKNAQQVREITDKLEQGIKELFESERYKEYLTTMSKFYSYSFNNTLLIAMQKPDATLIAGYTSWQRNFTAMSIREKKGIKILAPAPYKAQESREKIDPATRSPCWMQTATRYGNCGGFYVCLKVVKRFEFSQGIAKSFLHYGWRADRKC